MTIPPLSVKLRIKSNYICISTISTIPLGKISHITRTEPIGHDVIALRHCQFGAVRRKLDRLHGVSASSLAKRCGQIWLLGNEDRSQYIIYITYTKCIYIYIYNTEYISHMYLCFHLFDKPRNMKIPGTPGRFICWLRLETILFIALLVKELHLKGKR